MRYQLLPEGADPAGALPLDTTQIKAADEMLCGACSALLAVDHAAWGNTTDGSTPGTRGGTLLCNVCGTVNRTDRYVGAS